MAIRLTPKQKELLKELYDGASDDDMGPLDIEIELLIEDRRSARSLHKKGLIIFEEVENDVVSGIATVTAEGFKVAKELK
jgi:hypothetical protein